MTSPPAALSTVRTDDGALLAFHSIGDGPDLVIVHGAMQDGASQRDLATALAGDLRVHLVDRRGRGSSGARDAVATTAREAADLRAVLDATGARNVLGISSGAIIAVRAALAGTEIDRLALFEPPLSIDGSMRLERLPEFDRAVADGRLATMAALGMKLAEMGPSWMFGLPVPMLALVSRGMVRKPRMRALAEALPDDVAVVRENADRLGDFAAVDVPTLLIDGTATRPYLRTATAALAAVIPGANHVELPGLWHSATQNTDEYGHPEIVAPMLREFFAGK